MSGALTYFMPSATTTSIISTLSSSARAALIGALKSSALKTAGVDYRVYIATLSLKDGTSKQIQLSMTPDSTGRWLVAIW